MVPLYVQYMGLEAYGLVGFYAMLQGWFMLFDMGLTPALSRETARYNGGAVSGLDLRRLVRALEGVFLLIAALGLLTLILSTGPIASEWLTPDTVDVSEVERAIQIMAIIVVLRWICGLYRGVITGFEHIVWLSSFNIVIATLRFVLVVPYLIYVGASPSDFFSYQLIIAAVELTVLVAKTYNLLPVVQSTGWIRWQWAPLRNVMGFALSAAFTSAVWVLVMQTDKLLLSGMIPLSEYAIYTMGVLIAGGISILASPVTTAVLPRLVKLHAERDEDRLRRLYRDATQLVCVVTIPIALVLAFFPSQVLLAWTGQTEIATRAAPVLALYAIGNGILAFTGFSYLLQVARGNLVLHIVGNLIFVILFLPSLYFAVERFGMVGAGYAWILANFIPFVLWLPFVHKKFLKGTHLKWLLEDICAIMILPLIIAAVAFYFASWNEARWLILAQLIGIYLMLLIAAANSSSSFRKRLAPYFSLKSA